MTFSSSVSTVAATAHCYPRPIPGRSHSSTSIDTAVAPTGGSEPTGYLYSYQSDTFVSKEQQPPRERNDPPPRPMSRLGFFDDDGDDADVSADEFDSSSEAADSESDFGFDDDCERGPPAAPTFAASSVASESSSLSSDNHTAVPILSPIPCSPMRFQAPTFSLECSADPLPLASYSRIPSPLHEELDPFSSTPEEHVSPVPQPPLSRSTCHNHGRSRSALMHFKWFWAVREEGSWDADSSDEEDSDSTSVRPAVFQQPTSPRRRHVKRSAPMARHKARLVPLSVHPRRGALPGLRDPYSAQIDRCLAHVPLWTLSKSLWMFDVQIGLARMQDGEGEREGDGPKLSAGKEPEQWKNDDGEDEDALRARATSVSSTGSDDSDVTLVDTDTEDDDEVQDDKAFIETDAIYSLPSSSKHPSDAEPSSSKRVAFEPSNSSEIHVKTVSALRKLAQPSAPYTYAPPRRARQWTTDWYARWAVLVEATRWEREQCGLRVACAEAILAAVSHNPVGLSTPPAPDEAVQTVDGSSLSASVSDSGLAAVEREGDLSTLCAFAFARDTVAGCALAPLGGPSPSRANCVASADGEPRKRFFFACADADEESASEEESSGGEDDAEDGFHLARGASAVRA